MSTQLSPGPVPVQENQKKDNSRIERSKRPTKTLPTDRISPLKQLDIIRAYAAASANGARAATIQEVAEIVQMAPSTVSLANPFFSGLGLLQRTDTASYSPSDDTLAFLAAHEWKPETAAHKLSPAFRDSWFGQALIPRITYAPVDEETAVTVLAEACAAGPEHRKALTVVLDFMVMSGVVDRDGGQIKLLKGPADQVEPPATTEPGIRNGSGLSPSRITTSFDQTTAGVVEFNVNVQVDMKQFANWHPDRIARFFHGIAEVLSAKADVEKHSGSPRA